MLTQFQFQQATWRLSVGWATSSISAARRSCTSGEGTKYDLFKVHSGLMMVTPSEIKDIALFGRAQSAVEMRFPAGTRRLTAVPRLPRLPDPRCWPGPATRTAMCSVRRTVSYAEGRSYTPFDAHAKMQALHAHLGVQRAVVAAQLP